MTDLVNARHPIASNSDDRQSRRFIAQLHLVLAIKFTA